MITFDDNIKSPPPPFCGRYHKRKRRNLPHNLNWCSQSSFKILSTQVLRLEAEGEEDQAAQADLAAERDDACADAAAARAQSEGFKHEAAAAQVQAAAAQAELAAARAEAAAAHEATKAAQARADALERKAFSFAVRLLCFVP